MHVANCYTIYYLNEFEFATLTTLRVSEFQ